MIGKIGFLHGQRNHPMSRWEIGHRTRVPISTVSLIRSQVGRTIRKLNGVAKKSRRDRREGVMREGAGQGVEEGHLCSVFPSDSVVNSVKDGSKKKKERYWLLIFNSREKNLKKWPIREGQV